ncbi:hypothetical protein ABK040_006472 [Willaertia magna]
MTITDAAYQAQQSSRDGRKSNAVFLTSVVVTLVFILSLLGIFVGIIVFGASEKPDENTLTKQVDCNIRQIATRNCTNSCSLVVYIPMLGREFETEKFSQSLSVYNSKAGDTVPCYINTFYDNIDGNKVAIEKRVSNYEYNMTVAGSSLIATSVFLLAVSFTVGYFSFYKLLR